MHKQIYSLNPSVTVSFEYDVNELIKVSTLDRIYQHNDMIFVIKPDDISAVESGDSCMYFSNPEKYGIIYNNESIPVLYNNTNMTPDHMMVEFPEFSDTLYVAILTNTGLLLILPTTAPTNDWADWYTLEKETVGEEERIKSIIIKKAFVYDLTNTSSTIFSEINEDIITSINLLENFRYSSERVHRLVIDNGKIVPDIIYTDGNGIHFFVDGEPSNNFGFDDYGYYINTSTPDITSLNIFTKGKYIVSTKAFSLSGEAVDDPKNGYYSKLLSADEYTISFPDITGEVFICY